MNTSVFRIFSTAHDLPSSWDNGDKGCPDNPFLCRSRLGILEKVNPCGQRYYLLENQDRISLFLSYQHRLDIFTYGPGSLRLPVTIIGLPCSVSWPGLQIQEQDVEAFQHALKKIPGALLILNEKEPALDLAPTCAQGLTLPNCELDIRGLDFFSYLDKMRSHYRYKLRSSIKRFQGVKTRVLQDNREFNSRLYRLYEQVYKRSDFKLEKLSISFFQDFPATISVFSAGDTILGFTQTMLSEQGGQKEQIFLFGGLEYELNQQYHTYINMLLHVIRSGIEQGADRINLGQNKRGRSQIKSNFALTPFIPFILHLSCCVIFHAESVTPAVGRIFFSLPPLFFCAQRASRWCSKSWLALAENHLWPGPFFLVFHSSLHNSSCAAC